jgi:hypothetical protein
LNPVFFMINILKYLECNYLVYKSFSIASVIASSLLCKPSGDELRSSTLLLTTKSITPNS